MEIYGNIESGVNAAFAMYLLLFVVCPLVLALSGLIRKSGKFLYLAAALSIPFSLYSIGGYDNPLIVMQRSLTAPLLWTLSGYLVSRRFFPSLVLALLPPAIMLMDVAMYLVK